MSCTAMNCYNNSNQNYALVRYPQDKELRKKWISAVGRGKNWSPSSSQRLCEVHFKPSEIEFIAGRKQVKYGSVPSRFCICPLKDQEHFLRNFLRRNRHDHAYNEHKTNDIGNTQKDQIMNTSSQLLSKQQSSENNKQLKYKNHYDHTYAMSSQQKSLISLRKKARNLVKHQYGCVTTCKPLTIEKIKAIDKLEEIAEEKDGNAARG